MCATSYVRLCLNFTAFQTGVNCSGHDDYFNRNEDEDGNGSDAG